MSQLKDNCYVSVMCQEALGRGDRVVFDSDEALHFSQGDRGESPIVVRAASSVERSVGTCTRSTMAAGEIVAIKLHSGTAITEVTGACSAGQELYASGAGLLSPSGVLLEAVALEAATASGDRIEVMYQPYMV
jgi:hypothetical protein